jgi:hypothetical protein
MQFDGEAEAPPLQNKKVTGSERSALDDAFVVGAFCEMSF